MLLPLLLPLLLLLLQAILQFYCSAYIGLCFVTFIQIRIHRQTRNKCLTVWFQCRLSSTLHAGATSTMKAPDLLAKHQKVHDFWTGHDWLRCLTVIRISTLIHLREYPCHSCSQNNSLIVLRIMTYRYSWCQHFSIDHTPKKF